MDNKEYYQKNKEKIKQRAKTHYYQHREKKIQYALTYQKVNKDKKLVWNNNYRLRIRKKLVILLGSICIVCGTTERLEIDHKSAGGCKDREMKGDNHSMYRYYLTHPEEANKRLQLLCKKHNLDKEYTNSERWH